MESTPVLRLIQPAQEPLGLFFRPGHNDHRVLCQLLSEGRSSMTGVVFDPALIGPQEELRSEVKRRNLWTVLDPRMMELGTVGGFTRRRASLPWAGPQPHELKDLVGEGGQRAANLIAEFVVRHEFSAVLTPTHYLAKGVHDPWLSADLALVGALRRRLDELGRQDVALYYALSIPTSVFHDSSQRMGFKARVQSVEVDGIWLRVHPFGASSGHVTLQRYIQACRDLHSLNLPLVVDKAGNIGLALLAFGAVSGIEAGVSSGDKFDIGRLSRPQKPGKGFAPHARVYIPGLGVLLEKDLAKSFFDNRNMRAQFGCHQTECCRRGSQDTLADPRRHFIFTRMEEVGALSRVPASFRPNQYLDQVLRPATDRLGRVTQQELPAATKKRLEGERRRLDGWRHTLGEMSRTQPTTWSVVPQRRIVRRRGA